MNPGAGEICSVACALLWAIVTISLKRAGETVPPFELNLFKNIGIAMLLVPAVFFFEFDSWKVFSSSDIWILVLSGVVGVCIADWFLLASLNILGAGRNAILDCLYSPFVIIFAWFALGEQLTLNRIGGGLLVVAGILIATLPEQNSGKVKKLSRGIAYGIVAMISMAGAIVLAKPVLEKTPFFAAMEIRMLAGVASGVFGLLAVGKFRMFAKRSTSPEFPHLRVWVGICLPAFFAMCLWIQGYRLLDASLASILNQTSTFFILVLAYWFLGEKLNVSKVLGALVAFGGVAIVVL
ncbi:DMT family transporter [Opitutales bacterium]|nr:DMT family transporter [Opitutales bacterium]